MEQDIINNTTYSLSDSSTQTQNTQPLSLVQKIRTNIFFRILIFTLWLAGLILLSFFIGVQILYASAFAAFVGLDVKFLILAIGIIIIIFLIFSAFLRLAIEKWRIAFALTILLMTVLAPITIFVIPNSDLAMNSIENEAKYIKAVIEKEQVKYLNQVKISNVSEDIVENNPCKACRDTDTKSLVINFDFTTPLEGKYTFNLDAGYLGDNSSFIYLDKFWLNDLNHPTEDYYLSAGNHKLSFALPMDEILKKNIPGPYTLSLNIHLKNSEIETIYKETGIDVVSFTLYYNDNFYATKAYKGDEFSKYLEAIKFFSSTFIKELKGDEIGYWDIDAQVSKQGAYLFISQMKIVLSGNPEEFPMVVDFNKELTIGRQKIVLPVTIQSFGQGTDINKAKQILQNGYTLKNTDLSYCSPDDSELSKKEKSCAKPVEGE